VRGSGDGWVTCGLGHRHWGRVGAAGLLLRPLAGGSVLLQLRAPWSHHGDTWGLPGGARDEHETAVDAAVREAAEETSLDPSTVRPEAAYVDDHGGWSYTTVVASTADNPVLRPVGAESTAVRFVADAQVDELALHPGFARTWPLLRTLGPAPVLVVDAANTIGSRPDGWWRDRAGAVGRLRDELATAQADGFELGPLELTGLEPRIPGLRRFPEVVLVAEGAARGVLGTGGVTVVAANGSGDDAIVRVASAGRAGPRPVVVVTADRELRGRVAAVGASTMGPRSLLDLIRR
jgi:8-oxo-dGTP diphosphatase